MSPVKPLQEPESFKPGWDWGGGENLAVQLVDADHRRFSPLFSVERRRTR